MKTPFSVLPLYAVLFVLSAAALLFSTQFVRAQSYELSPLWNLAPGTYEWVSTNNTQRGLAYNPATTHLLSVSRFPATNAAVYILESTNGAAAGNLNTNGIFAGINFPLNMIGVASDGVIYACNLTVDSTNTAIGNNGPFRIYRWANEAAEPTIAYLGDPSEADAIAGHRRFGDSLAVRGAGANTEILAGTRAGKIVARFTTADGLTFTHQKINAPELLGVTATCTIAFGSSNTFWVKAEVSAATNYALQHFSYDPIGATAALIRNYSNSTLLGGPLGLDVDRGLLGIIRAVSHQLRFFRLAGSGFVQQDIVRPFPAANANGNFTGSVVFGGDKLFALESNNGIMAFNILTNTLVSFSAAISAQTGQVTLTWPSQSGFLYQPQFKNSLSDLTWTNLGASTNGTGTVISVDDDASSNAKFYRVSAE